MSITEQGYQFCTDCNKETLHIPKLGLISSGVKLCVECRKYNKYEI